MIELFIYALTVLAMACLGVMEASQSSSKL